MKFKVGQKVRCVDTNWRPLANKPEPFVYPAYQGIYTVSSKSEKFPTGIRLEEIPKIQFGVIQNWDESHFEAATETGEEIIVYAKELIKVKEHQYN